MKNLLHFFFSLFAFQSLAQVQWASQVIGVSSEFRGANTPNQYQANQVVGKPNVLPFFGISPCAWVPHIALNQSKEWLKVGFEKPQSIEQIVVAENYNAGAIIEIFAYDTENKEYKVYQRAAHEGGRANGNLWHLEIEKTPYKVAALKIVMSNEDNFGWTHIDAIGICEKKQKVEVKINLAKDIGLPTNIESLGATINSPYEEILPIIATDGKTLYFDRKNHPENTKGYQENDDIWFSQFQDGKWTSAQKMPAPLNNRNHNYVCTALPDGNTLLLGNKYLSADSCVAGLSISQRTGKNTWSFPKEVIIKEYLNRSIYSEFYLANNQKILLLAVEGMDTNGDRDLYVSFLEDDGKWSKPKNLGKTINSAGTEMTPFLASDLKTLYFSSNGFSGYGNADVYISRRLDDSWTSWSEPMNLGNQFNSPEWEASYSIDAAGEYAYFVSYKNSINESADIFRAKLPTDAKPDPVMIISGKVLSAKTNLPVAASIVYETLPDGKEAGRANADPVTGEYKITLPLRSQYGFWAKADGYLSVDENINLKDSSSFIEITRDLLLAPIEVGQYVRLNNIFFAQGKADFMDGSLPELKRIVKIMQENTKMKIEIAGHTDIDGSTVANFKLSEQRIQSIQKYMTSQGIDISRIKTVAYGETKPISTARTDEAKYLNRRVEFRILEY